MASGSCLVNCDACGSKFDDCCWCVVTVCTESPEFAGKGDSPESCYDDEPD